MENASKAFLIAGGVLIAILILSLGVYLVSTYGKLGTTYEGVTQENEIKKFNSNFTSLEGRTDITAQEIVTTINFCDEYENNYGTTASIVISNAGWSTDKIKTKENGEIAFITDCTSKEYKFRCNTIYDNETGMVKTIIFTKISN